MHELKNLGHIIDRKGVKMDPDGNKGIEDIEFPKIIIRLQSLLGLFSYYLKLIKNLVKITEPLHQKIKKFHMGEIKGIRVSPSIKNLFRDINDTII